MVLNVQALLMKRDSPISALSLYFGHFNPSLDVEMKEAKWVLECHSSPPGTGTLHEKNDFSFLKIKILSILRRHDAVEGEQLGQGPDRTCFVRSITGGRYPFALSPIFLLTTGDWERTFLQSLLSISSYSGYSWVAAYWHLCRNLNWTRSTKISHNMWARLRGVRTTLNAVFKRLRETASPGEYRLSKALQKERRPS